MTKLRILSIFFVLALIVSACSSSNDSGAGGETAATVGDTAASANADNEADRPEAEGQHHEAADRVVQVTAHEFGFSLDTIEVHVGETVRFEVTNEGVIEHEFRLTNQDEIDAHLAMGHEAMHDEGEGEEHATFMLVPPGETKTIDLTFDADGVINLFACMLPGHYEAGMVGNLEITG